MAIHIVEVGPRDGLQNEKAVIPTQVKVAFINALSQTGLAEIEVSSFVSPQWVPQLADAPQVFEQITRKPGVKYTALVPNERGLSAAIEAKADKVAVFTAASETFNQKNINATIAESIERFKPILASSPVPVRGYVSTAFHCPYEGKVHPADVVRVIQMLLDIGVSEISIGDTIGKAAPDEVRQLLDAVFPICPAEIIALHFHDTFGNAIANVRAGFEMGIRVFDSSAGGLGGCPFAPGAKGNVATEAIIRAFPNETGVDLNRIRDAAAIVANYLNSSEPPPHFC